MNSSPRLPRILIVDDNRAIHDDFRKILMTENQSVAALDAEEAALFGAVPRSVQANAFQIDSAYQGNEAIDLMTQALDEGYPYSVAFMDVRMPPGLDGIETTAALWHIYPDIQIVLCTAYSDYSWDELLARLGQTDRLVILKKPFDNIEVLQLAHALAEKWRLLQQSRVQMADLEKMVNDRTAALREANERLENEVKERKAAQAALEESQQMVMRQERLAAVGQLSAGVAHDFNNIMTVIHGHAGLMMLNGGIPEEARHSIQEIEGAAGRASKLTRQLLAFSRKQVMRAAAINLGEVASRMIDMLNTAVGDHIALRVSYPPDLPMVQADATMVEQVLMNLTVNARDAMPDGGDLTVTLERVELDGAAADRNPEAARGSYLRLRVADTGCGMDPVVLGRLFEPFFTTKDVGKGTGLGLSTVYGIVKQHGGFVEVESTVGKGSTFDIYFPVVAVQESAEPKSRGRESAGPGHGETILLVEDEPALRFLVRRVLESNGYRVIEADSGRAALEVWHDRSAQIDLLLTDMVMPGGISGKDLAGTLLADKPHLKIIYTSGYCKDPTCGTSQDAHALYLSKPYTPPTLLATVRRCFDGPGLRVIAGAAAA